MKTANRFPATNGRHPPPAARPQIDYVIPDFGDLWQPDLTVLPNGWAVAVAEIGPDLATAMLALNADNQRKLIRSNIDRFANDMLGGDWFLTHQGIAFSRDGKLHDGQNRLTAVVESGSVADMLVFFGAGSQHEMSVFDTGKGRTSVDSARVLGLDADRLLTTTVTVAYRMARASKAPFNLSHTGVNELILKYGDDGRKVLNWYLGGKPFGTDRAPIRAAILAALVCGVDEKVLVRFVNVLCDRESATIPGDKAAVSLRNQIQKLISRNRGGGSTVAQTVFLSTCQAILHAARGHETQQLKPCAESPFIFPESA